MNFCFLPEQIIGKILRLKRLMKLIDLLVMLENCFRIGVAGDDVVGAALQNVGELLAVHLTSRERLCLEPVAGRIDSGCCVKTAVEAADVEKRCVILVDDSGFPVLVDVLCEACQENLILRGPKVVHIPAAAEDNGIADHKREEDAGCNPNDISCRNGSLLGSSCGDPVKKDACSRHSGDGKGRERKGVVGKVCSADIDKEEGQCEHQGGSDPFCEGGSLSKEHPEKSCNHKDKILEVVQNEPVQELGKIVDFL